MARNYRAQKQEKLQGSKHYLLNKNKKNVLKDDKNKSKRVKVFQKIINFYSLKSKSFISLNTLKERLVNFVQDKSMESKTFYNSTPKAFNRRRGKNLKSSKVYTSKSQNALSQQPNVPAPDPGGGNYGADIPRTSGGDSSD